MAQPSSLFDPFDENTPHLDNNSEAQTNVLTKMAQASAYYKRPIQILIIITLILSTLTIALLIANLIVIKHAPFGYYTDYARGPTKQLLIFMFVSLVFSIINVLVNFPILLNIIVDIVLTACIIPRVFSFFDAIPGTGNLDWCQPQRRYPSPEPIPPHPRCEDWKLIVKIVMGIATGFGGIVGVIYVALLVLRIIAMFRTKFWKRPLTLTFPTGKISLEISLKFLKQENTGNIQGMEQGTDAGERGPLYLS